MVRSGLFASRDEWDAINRAAPDWNQVQQELEKIVGLHSGKSRLALLKERKELYASRKDQSPSKVRSIERKIEAINRSFAIRCLLPPFGITRKGEFLGSNRVHQEAV